LISLYARDDNIASMQHFTERFKSQLVRMATSEVDLSVRVSCIHVLRAIDRHGLLEEEQRDEVAALIFEEEKRVREGIAGFFAGLVDEQVSEIQIEMDADHHRKNKEQKKTKTSERETRLRFKCLAKLLVKYGKHLDRSTSGGGDDAIGVDDDDDYDEDEITKKIDLDIIRADRGRIAFAVDSLWDSVDILRDWQGLIDYLLLDHSTSDSGNMNDGNGTPKAKKRKSKEEAAKDDTIEVEPEHRLREEEETVLIEVLVASLSKATGSAATTKKVSSCVSSR
jgi:cohesin complex subunit SA-1/2